MDRTTANTQSWIAFRFQFYMALITRCNIWSQLNTLNPFTTAAPCVSHRYDAGKNSTANQPLTDDQARYMQGGGDATWFGPAAPQSFSAAQAA